MSAYYSKFALNTYAWTPYFQAAVPADYPLPAVLQAAHAFRRLPPNLRELAAESKKWALANGFDPAEIDRWYDAQGYELDPETGRRLTDREVDAQWPDPPSPAPGPDLPASAAGFMDPTTWQPPADTGAADPPSDEQILEDVASHGIARTEAEYGISLPAPAAADPPDLTFDEAHARFVARTEAVLKSDYFAGRGAERAALDNALLAADLFDDLWGPAEQAFVRAEEYETVKTFLGAN